MSSPIRVRFAPSPTGFLHIGGVRAALFNWLFARHHGGQFLLRIEDTDLERSEERYTADILASLKWLGLTWDEEPIFQSKRLGEYRARAEELVQKGLAYRCTCTEADVEKMREKAQKAGKKPMYDRSCRDKGLAEPQGTPFVIRAKLPLEGAVEFEDLIRGTVKVENEEMDDFVLIRSNGAPTYNLSVVVDDVFSRMTHVIRGDDHINNTPKQLHLYRAFGYPLPKFAHLPMILGSDKKKLSKRHGAVSANAYREEGYLPDALLNFLARLGWSHGDQEIFTSEEMVKLFSFDHVQKSSAVFNQEKLLWLNGHYLRSTPAERLLELTLEDCAHHFTEPSRARAKTALGVELVRVIQPKVKLLPELASQLIPLCIPGAIEIDASQVKWGKDGTLKGPLLAAIKHAHEQMAAKLAGAEPVRRTGADQAWGTSPSLAGAGLDGPAVDALLRQVGDQHGVKLGDLVQPMRVLVTGRTAGASLFEVLALLPWDVLDARLARASGL